MFRGLQPEGGRLAGEANFLSVVGLCVRFTDEGEPFRTAFHTLDRL
jgi:hypothetical protein